MGIVGIVLAIVGVLSVSQIEPEEPLICTEIVCELEQKQYEQTEIEQPNNEKPDYRYDVARGYLAETSYRGSEELFLGYADDYNVDVFLLLAVGAHESGHYTARFCPYWNCWGITDGRGGFARYGSQSAGIEAIARLLSNSRYREFTYPNGVDVYGVQLSGYATDPNWTTAVSRIHQELRSRYDRLEESWRSQTEVVQEVQGVVR